MTVPEDSPQVTPDSSAFPLSIEQVRGNLPTETLRHSPPETFFDLARPLYDEAIQTLPRDQLRELQTQRLKAAVRTVWDGPVEFFQRKLEAAGATGPGDIKSLDDLSDIPPTVKQELRESEAEHPPVGDYRGVDLRQCIRMGTSTGTTGTPTIMLWTRHDILVELEAGARSFWRQGIRPGMILTHAHPAYLYGGGLLLTSLYEFMGCLPIWVPPPDTDDVAMQGLDMWSRITPDKPFMGFATGRFVEVARKNDIELNDVGLDFSKMPPLTKDGILPLMTSGSECMAYLGSACGELNGGHICEDYAIVQAVNPDTGNEVEDGEWGHLVVTTLDRDNFMIRYDLEEAVKLDHAECACGETHARGWWGGRFKDLITTQGRSFLLPEIENVIKSVKQVGGHRAEYQVVRPSDADSPLKIRIEAADDDDGQEIMGEVTGQLEAGLGVRVAVELLGPESLPRAGYKPERVVDA